jgi:N-acetyl-anhydromuramyl-L-alanine amidase AmpD
MSDVAAPASNVPANLPLAAPPVARPAPAPAAAAAPFRVNEGAMLPLEDGQAVTPGWPAKHNLKPLGVTWHWTVTWNLAVCRQVLGGRRPERKGVASAHYGVGRSFAEGIDRYVALENRSWHAGKGQTVRWDGRKLDDPDFKGSRSTVGIETINIGSAEGSIRPGPDWIAAHTSEGRQLLRVQPWTEEQVEMMVWVGKEIIARFPHITMRDHHGHHDLCPGYKVDVAGFPFARVLSGIYDTAVPDVWTPTWSAIQRQRVLQALGYDLGPAGPDGSWGPRSSAALREFQSHVGLYENGMWNTFTAWRAYDVLAESGIALADAAGAPR